MGGGHAQIAQHHVIANLDGVGADVCDGAQRVEAADRFDFKLLGAQHHPLAAAIDGDRQHQSGGLGCGWNRADLAADDQHATVL